MALMENEEGDGLTLNPFLFHFNFLNNPQTTQSTHNHIHSHTPTPLYTPFNATTLPFFPLSLTPSSRNLLERGLVRRILFTAVHFISVEKRMRIMEKYMETQWWGWGWCVLGGRGN